MGDRTASEALLHERATAVPFLLDRRKWGEENGDVDALKAGGHICGIIPRSFYTHFGLIRTAAALTCWACQRESHWRDCSLDAGKLSAYP